MAGSVCQKGTKLGRLGGFALWRRRPRAQVEKRRKLRASLFLGPLQRLALTLIVGI